MMSERRHELRLIVGVNKTNDKANLMVGGVLLGAAITLLLVLLVSLFATIIVK